MECKVPLNPKRRAEGISIMFQMLIVSCLHEISDLTQEVPLASCLSGAQGSVAICNLHRSKSAWVVTGFNPWCLKALPQSQGQ